MQVDINDEWEAMDIPDAKYERPQCYVCVDYASPGILEVVLSLEGPLPRLSRETVRALIPHLQAFVDTGSLEIRESK
jgi:hypothetical protein